MYLDVYTISRAAQTVNSSHNPQFIHAQISNKNTQGTTEDRTREFSEWSVLKPRRLWVEPQDEVDKLIFSEDNFRAHTIHGDAWNNSYSSLRNLLRQYYSLEQVTTLVETTVAAGHAAKYDLIMYVRPDVFFLNKLDTKGLVEAAASEGGEGKPTVYIPDFSPAGGVNDRFAFGKPDAVMKYWGRRGRFAREYCKSFPLHSEKFLAYVLSTNDVAIKYTNIVFGRVRANGKLYDYPAIGDGGVIETKWCANLLIKCPDKLTTRTVQLKTVQEISRFNRRDMLLLALSIAGLGALYVKLRPGGGIRRILGSKISSAFQFQAPQRQAGGIDAKAAII